MTKFKLDSELLKLMAYFETLSGAKVKDCISDDKVTFMIEEGDMGRAIGKNGSNIKMMESRLRKRIKLVEYSSVVENFIRNLVSPIEVAEIKNENGTITIHCSDSNSRAMIIGRERKNIHHLLDIVNRYFDVKEIRVV